MLWNEFIEGTGCKDNEKNYKVYKDLEIMYMNSDMTKAEIYEYGKKLVDNSKSEEEIRVENEIKEEIQYWKGEVDRLKRILTDEQERLDYWKLDGDKEMTAICKNSVRYIKDEIKQARAKINALKWVLA